MFEVIEEEINTTPNPPSSPRTRQRIEKILQAEEAQRSRTWRYYETLRNEKPSLYWKPETQKQMLDDAAELGSAFRDGGFDD